jgi:DNA excision repair protein ERCC-5
MGVTGLWTVLEPCARPVKLETLNKKRLAVDASIWIYQFLKAVRDKEGNALRNSHVVGFFRRICKLLFFGIKPVFVFDGDAPALKRATIAARKKRREGRREDAVRTAGKLLAMQMQRKAEEEAQKQREQREVKRTANEPEEEPLPVDLVYVDELQLRPEERQAKKFKKKDQYHLPDLDIPLEKLAGANDPRVMSADDLEAYARQFHSGEDISVYDFSKIDFDSHFFASLPAADRYNILNAARLRSRLRMGYSKEQLDTMFPDRMAFSRFQIERVAERNDLTQRLMNINGMNGPEAMFGDGAPGRVASERGREYILVKNDGVEGGWALGVVGGNKEIGQRNKPIDVDELDAARQRADLEADIKDDEEDDDFEDVPIEGLNRLPRRDPAVRPDVYGYGHQGDLAENPIEIIQDVAQDGDDEQALFVPDTNPPIANEAKDITRETGHDIFDDDTEDLEMAIAMSLQTEEMPIPDKIDQATNSLRSGSKITRLDKVDSKIRAGGFLVEDSASSNLVVPKPAKDVFGAEKTHPENPFSIVSTPKSVLKPVSKLDKEKSSNPFDGPLPFERLDFGKSILGKKKPKTDNEQAKSTGTEENATTMPPWFSKNDQSIPQPTEARRTEPPASGRSPKSPNHRDISIGLSRPSDVTDYAFQIPLDHGKLAVENNPHVTSNDVLDIDVAADDTMIVDPVEATADRNLDYFDPEAPQEEAEFSDPEEEEELMRAMAEEVEEHARFAAELNKKTQAESQGIYEQELKNLRTQQRKDRRDADEVNSVMITECQQLLTLFGLPYITAPMEAEAQCAELVRLGLVDGIVTDDSDTFLFGGTRIYKNMFSQAKFVECYLTEDLEREYDLSREKLIDLAQLLGSDYTEGIPNVGPVTALEIITEFAGTESLEDFRDWLSSIQDGSNQNIGSLTGIRKKLKRSAGKIFVPPSFPDLRVKDAYFRPEVDSDPTQFLWGVPDLAALRSFLMATIGWTQDRTDEVLVPVIRDMNRRENEGTQANITRFYGGTTGSGVYAPKKVLASGGRRMENALLKLATQARAKRRAANGVVEETGATSHEQGAIGQVIEQWFDDEDIDLDDDGKYNKKGKQKGASRKHNISVTTSKPKKAATKVRTTQEAKKKKRRRADVESSDSESVIHITSESDSNVDEDTNYEIRGGNLAADEHEETRSTTKRLKKTALTANTDDEL